MNSPAVFRFIVPGFLLVYATFPVWSQDNSPKPAEKVDVVKLPIYGYTTTPMLPNQPWRVHDLYRPQPREVTPGKDESQAPADAIVLFDGTNLSNWFQRGEKPGELLEPQWTIADDAIEVVPGTGSLYSIDSFGSCQLHLEWATPTEITGASQQRGASGIRLMDAFEIHILDSHRNRTFADGLAGSVYGVFPPLVNASREPGQWQSFDIIFEAPEFEAGELIKKAHATVLHNGLVVQHRRELPGISEEMMEPKYEPMLPAGPLVLLDRGSKVRFRNIWIRPL